MAWRFYVYELADQDGIVRYVGKGSGCRLSTQERNYCMSGREVARFKREKDAYAFEVERIAELRPSLNKHPGGNGSFATVRREPRKPQWLAEMERIGTRAYAARFLLQKLQAFKHLRSKVEYSKDLIAAFESMDERALAEVAYGARA